MFGFRASRRAILDAINRSQAIVEFGMDGTIRTANDKFLEAFGYTLSELKGRHHRILLAPGDDATAAYEAFWGGLRLGRYQSAEYRRLAKAGGKSGSRRATTRLPGGMGSPPKS